MQTIKMFKFWLIPNDIENISEYINSPKKFDGVAELWKEGKTLNELVKLTGYAYPAIRKYLIDIGIYKEFKIKRSMVKSERDEEFIRLYTKELKSLAEIGEIYGFTREYIRQRLKIHGYDRLDGGHAIKTAINKSNNAKNKKVSPFELRCLSYFGCSREVRDKYGKPNKYGTLSCAFKTQKNTAKQRNIEWQLTLPEWIEIWEESGHLHERGVGSGKYVMTRVCDMGSYSKDNVVIKTNNQNAIESREMDYVTGRFSKKESMVNLAKKHNMKISTLYGRLRLGWDLQKALNTPISQKIK